MEFLAYVRLLGGDKHYIFSLYKVEAAKNYTVKFI